MLTVSSIIPSIFLEVWLKSSYGITYPAAGPPSVETWTDQSVYGNGAYTSGTQRPQLVNGVVDFTAASNERMIIGSNATLDFGANLTIAMRVRFDVLAGGWLTKSDGVAGSWSVQYAGTTLRFWADPVPGVNGVEFNTPLTTGIWYTILFIYDGSGPSIRVRIDGAELTVLTTIGTIPATLPVSTNDIWIAAYSTGAQDTDFQVQELVLTSAALTAQQILDLEYVLTYGPLYSEGNAGITQVDFGAFPGKSDASVVVTGQGGIQASSLVEAWLMPLQTPDHSSDEHLVETIQVRAADIVAGVGFTVHATNTSQLNEPLATAGPSRFRSAAATVYGYVSPSVGGKGTNLYGLWSVGWVWV